ncbi:MAG TPA: hypothetical protein VK338_05605 [Candidatus Nitrosocosmicus sp.]|nr:hypothetical protein [Candidatus Nitrosocosmicus sp.]
MDNNETAQKLASIVLDVYNYAYDNNIDITSQDEVRKVLETLNLELPNDVTIDTLIEGLVAFHKTTKAEVQKRRKVKLEN